MSVRCNGSRCCDHLHLHVKMFSPEFTQCLTLSLSLSLFLSLKPCFCFSLLPSFAYICKKNFSLTFALFLSISCRPAPVFPPERKRKWCHATTTALRGTTGVPGSGETSVLLASTMEEPIIAVPLPLSMATTVRGSFPSQSSLPSSQRRSQLPWQHQATT